MNISKNAAKLIRPLGWLAVASAPLSLGALEGLAQASRLPVEAMTGCSSTAVRVEWQEEKGKPFNTDIDTWVELQCEAEPHIENIWVKKTPSGYAANGGAGGAHFYKAYFRHLTTK